MVKLIAGSGLDIYHGVSNELPLNIKRSGIKTNAQVKGYTKQPPFTGSRREVRGAILRALTDGYKTKQALMTLFPPEREVQILEVLEHLVKEGMIRKNGTRYHLPE